MTLLRTQRAPAAFTPTRTAAALSATIAFFIYLRTMLPGVSVQDWAEMQYIPAQLGVPHPTGFPPGPTLDLPYGQRYLDHRGTLYQLELKGGAGG